MLSVEHKQGALLLLLHGVAVRVANVRVARSISGPATEIPHRSLKVALLAGGRGGRRRWLVGGVVVVTPRGRRSAHQH